MAVTRRRRASALLVAAVGAVVLLAAVVFGLDRSAASDVHRAAGSAPLALPTAAADRGLAEVGPLFPHGMTGSHTCTGSVVASAGGDTVLTAAHCLDGPVRGMVFAPGYREGHTPYGVWTVIAAYVTTPWLLDQTPADDIAVLTVADRTVDGHSRTLASVTGAETVGATPAPGTRIRVEAYNAGSDDDPQTCTVPMTLSHGHPTFYCHGFVGGSSGSPWLLASSSTPEVVGAIGGRHQGGCSEHTSHSTVFGAAVVTLVARAGRGGAGDDPPAAGSDDCPTTSP